MAITQQQKKLYRALTMIAEGETLEDAARDTGLTVGEIAAEIAEGVAE
jgi:hypothetical protein